MDEDLVLTLKVTAKLQKGSPEYKEYLHINVHTFILTIKKLYNSKTELTFVEWTENFTIPEYRSQVMDFSYSKLKDNKDGGKFVLEMKGQWVPLSLSLSMRMDILALARKNKTCE